ncbi:MAG: HNH endonuclease [Thaumarchaeota archaeon]|nr:HNH endonuclease [Nitrososphaerota archaeon]
MPNQYTKNPFSIEERLLPKIKKTQTCWIWGGTLLNGHGVVHIGRKMKYADRLMYELHYGKIPGGRIVEHTCKKSRCVNPEHLVLSTRAALVVASTERFRANIEDRLLSKITRSQAGKGQSSECWLWEGRTINGHGVMIVDKRTKYVERLMYELRKGEIPEGKLVLHSCGNTRCINPAHIYLGTPSDRNKKSSNSG